MPQAQWTSRHICRRERPMLTMMRLLASEEQQHSRWLLICVRGGKTCIPGRSYLRRSNRDNLVLQKHEKAGLESSRAPTTCLFGPLAALELSSGCIKAAEIRQDLAIEQRRPFRCHDTIRDPARWERRLFVMCEQRCLDSDACIRRLQSAHGNVAAHRCTMQASAIEALHQKGPDTPVQMSWGNLWRLFASAVERDRLDRVHYDYDDTFCL
jgi:hypothetical protein